MKALSQRGIHTGIILMPVLPFITDSIENIQSIVEEAHSCGAEYILASFGVTLRDRQRDYFLARIESLFPGLAEMYREHFGNSYMCRSRDAQRLEKVYRHKCMARGISTSIPVYDPLDTGQLSLF